MFKLTSIILAIAPLALSHALLPRSDLTLESSTGSTSLSSPNPLFVFKRQGCSTGYTECGTGCMPALTTNTCCVSYYCKNGTSCDSDGTCTCLATEKKCGTSCIPIDATCCPLDLKYCAAGKYCAPVKGYCCNNGEDPSACASRVGFTIVGSATAAPTSTFSAAASSTSTFKPVTTPTSAAVVSSTKTTPSTTSTTPKPTSTTPVFGLSTTTPSSSSSASTTSTPDVVVLTVTASSSRSSTFATVPTGAAVANGVDIRALMAGGFAGLVGLVAL